MSGYIKVDGIYLGSLEVKILDLVDMYNEISVWRVAEYLTTARYYKYIYQIFYRLQKKGLVELKKVGKRNGLIASLTPLGKNMLIKTVLEHEEFFHQHVVEA